MFNFPYFPKKQDLTTAYESFQNVFFPKNHDYSSFFPGQYDFASAYEGMQNSFKAEEHNFKLEDHDYSQYCHDLGLILQTHTTRSLETTQRNSEKNLQAWTDAVESMMDPLLTYKWWEYMVDGAQRSILYTDALRQRGNFFVEHEEDANKTVLSWKHEMVIDGSTLARPVNYSLVRIVPPEGVVPHDELRPYIIIDPRAGHGSGIGGFKNESEVGCAIHNGHPTYFVTFTRMPIKGQKIEDVTAAEATFVREVQHLHPQSPQPVIVGNCQGGWAAMLLAATNPDITGPVVANGAPLSYWAGQKGDNPMRYMGGLVGGAVTTRIMSDLGNGNFDGACLVENFENLSPSNTKWQKYYTLYDNIDTEVPRFVGFERWWGSFYYMTPDEIDWIVDSLFVGNRLGRGQANLNERSHLDLRNIKSPIIIFASHGDNITPPQQALGWLADFYDDVDEIRVRGQRIIYTLHPSVGHLGIFVSSSVAKKEHEEITSTLPAVEALAPGLYEMVITEEKGEGIDKHFTVAFTERTIEHVMVQCGGNDSDKPFAAVARFSEIGTEMYDLALRPIVKAMANQATAEFMANTSPMRLPRWLQSDRNPLMQPVKGLADLTRQHRKAVSADNPFRKMERFGAGLITQSLDNLRDFDKLKSEWQFHTIWAAPQVQALGEHMSKTVSKAPREDLRTLTEVQDALDRIDQGGFAEGVIRMLIFLAQSRREVRRTRLERSNEMLLHTEPFSSMDPKKRTRMIHRETLIVGFEPERALETLPKLIAGDIDRKIALDLCTEIAGPEEEMTPETASMMQRLAMVIDLEPPFSNKVAQLEDPSA